MQSPNAIRRNRVWNRDLQSQFLFFSTAACSSRSAWLLLSSFQSERWHLPATSDRSRPEDCFRAAWFMVMSSPSSSLLEWTFPPKFLFMRGTCLLVSKPQVLSFSQLLVILCDGSLGTGRFNETHPSETRGCGTLNVTIYSDYYQVWKLWRTQIICVRLLW